MSNKYTVNKKVAVTPFPTTDAKTEIKGGLVVFKQKQELTVLEVVFPNLDENRFGPQGDISLYPGDRVCVRGDVCKHAFAKEIYEIDGKSFILLPLDLIVMVLRQELEEKADV